MKSRIVISIHPLLLLLLVAPAAAHAQHDEMSAGKTTPLDIATIERVTGMKGKENQGEYKITVPQNDLQVTVDNFKIIPAMGLGSWAAFTPSTN